MPQISAGGQMVGAGKQTIVIASPSRPQAVTGTPQTRIITALPRSAVGAGGAQFIVMGARPSGATTPSTASPMQGRVISK